MSTQPTPQPDIVTQMVQDPDFGKMAVSEQRKALAAHDPLFQQADDNAIGQFVQAHQKASPQAQPQQQPDSFWGGVGRRLKSMIPEEPKSPLDYAMQVPIIGTALQVGLGQAQAERQLAPQLVQQAKAGAASHADEPPWRRGLIPSLEDLRTVTTGLSMLNPFASASVANVNELENQGRGREAAGQGATDATLLAAGSKTLTNPLNAILRRGLLLGKTPEGAYESALKPSTVMPPEQRAGIVKTALEEGIPVSKKGLDDLGGRIDALNEQIKNMIAADPDRPINTAHAVKNLASVQQRFSNQVNPRADVQAIQSAGQEFQDIYGQQMPAAQAQEIKQGTYRALGDKAYGELKGASIEAQKGLARGLKEELARQFPELDQLNARDSRLLDLQDSLERAVGRISNHQIAGIGTPIVASGVKAVTNSGKLGLVAGFMKAVLDNPSVKSRLAIALSQGKIPPVVTIPRIAAYYGSLGRPLAPLAPLPQFLQQPSGDSGQSPNQ